MRRTAPLLLVLLVLVLDHAAPITAHRLVAPVEQAACTAPAERGTLEGTLDFDGIGRTYRLYLPDSYQSGAPLVLSLHGFASNARQQQALSGWDDVADEHGFAVAYPQGTGVPLRWEASRVAGRGADDVGFLRALIGQLIETYCLDGTRVYMTGLSNGGGMTYHFACEAADMVAAIGTVAGAYTDDACAFSRPMPVIAFHGDADPIVPYTGGMGGALPDIPAWAGDVAALDGCTDEQTLATPDNLTAIRYESCNADVAVVFYTVIGGGHTWPGVHMPNAAFLGETARNIEASAIMWDFFEGYALVGTSA